jgi:hypothetical protein
MTGQLIEHAIQPVDAREALILAMNAERLAALIGGDPPDAVTMETPKPASRQVA